MLPWRDRLTGCVLALTPASFSDLLLFISTGSTGRNVSKLGVRNKRFGGGAWIDAVTKNSGGALRGRRQRII